MHVPMQYNVSGMRLPSSLQYNVVYAAQEFMSQHGFNGIPDFLGASLPYFTTHMELVRVQPCIVWRFHLMPLPCLPHA